VDHTALFIGAHPDDIEIGAGATAAKLVAFGWNVYFCILTAERDEEEARERDNEARRAAARLGVAKERVFFVRLPDGELEAGRKHIDAIRSAIASRVEGKIDLVFSHSRADTHIDHQNAHRLTPQLVKYRPVLCYPIVNHMKASDFKPRIYVDVSDHQDQKREALEEYTSQVEKQRILFDEVEKLSAEYGAECDRSFVEAFELESVRPTSRNLLELAGSLSCREPAPPESGRSSRWIAGFAVLAMLAAAGWWLVDLRELLHVHRGSIVLEDFESGSHVAGRVEGFTPEECADLKVVVYVLTNSWYIHPWDSAEEGKGYAAVAEDGSWRISTDWRGHQARRLAILLAKRSNMVPSRVRPLGNADRRLLTRVDHLTALIVQAPDGI
jgi:LmbE family N-acetylglucosaminyl deacetylase